jgi:predicted pyridoxine 5'-phosphate oxidase superfamily flavin-nucleotide-binding protein
MPNKLFHEGELRVQSHLGVSQMAARIGTGIRKFIQPAAMEWLESQVLAAVASRGQNGSLWASLLTGPPGFLRVEGENELAVIADLSTQGPLLDAFAGGEAMLGLIVLEPQTRRRLRLNGRGMLSEEGLLLVADEVYGNCPKYIQTRSASTSQETHSPLATTGSELSAAQQEFIRRADTLFIATAHPTRNADCSHRGGNPGFVSVLSTTHLEWEDYSGNAMFNTLGNLEVDPHCGLLFLNWESGATWQLSGKARTRWEGETRITEFEVERWRETENATALRWQFGEFSPFNP